LSAKEGIGMTRNLAILFLALSVSGMTLPVFGEEGSTQPAQAVRTEHLSFAPGGTIGLNNSFGSLTLEGWDRSEVEITTIKSIDALKIGD
jgi:hypothetical protein